MKLATCLTAGRIKFFANKAQEAGGRRAIAKNFILPAVKHVANCILSTLTKQKEKE